jgi:hypothetical protein
MYLLGPQSPEIKQPRFSLSSHRRGKHVRTAIKELEAVLKHLTQDMIPKLASDLDSAVQKSRRCKRGFKKAEKWYRDLVALIHQHRQMAEEEFRRTVSDAVRPRRSATVTITEASTSPVRHLTFSTLDH